MFTKKIFEKKQTVKKDSQESFFYFRGHILKIVHITDTPIALAPARFVDLINKCTRHQAYLLQNKNFFLGNPFTDNSPRHLHDVIKALEMADILHFHGSKCYSSMTYAGLSLKRFLAGKRLILHYHGSPERENFKKYQTTEKLLVSTPEMLPLFPNAKFFPNLIDEKDVNLYVRRKPSNLEEISVCHHFSLHPDKKDTDIFCNLEKYKFQNNLKFYKIEKCGLRDALKNRAEFDVVFDHLQGYYGLVSTEALLQNMLVVNGCNSFCKAKLEEFFGDIPPFFYTSYQTLYEDLSEISKKLVEKYAEKGLKFMMNQWSGRKNIQKLIQFYES